MLESRVVRSAFSHPGTRFVASTSTSTRLMILRRVLDIDSSCRVAYSVNKAYGHDPQYVHDDCPRRRMASYDPFDAAHLLNIPDLAFGIDTTWQEFRVDKELQCSVFSLPDVEHENLQDLQAGAFTLDFEEAPLPSLEVASASSYTTAEDDINRRVDTLDEEPWKNVWTFSEVTDSSRQLKLTSWDHFCNYQHKEPGTADLSEARAATFDAITACPNTAAPTAPLVVTDRFLHALYELGLGRSSVLFQWLEEEDCFTQSIDNFAVRGCTPEVVQHIVDSTAAAGRVMRKLSEATRSYLGGRPAGSPSVLAFQSTLNSCLMAIQQYMDSRRYDIISILRFEQAFLNVLLLLELLGHLASLVEDSDNDHSLLASLLERATTLSNDYPLFVPLLNQIISFVAKPVLEELSCDIGLPARHCSTREEAHIDESDWWTAVLSADILQRVREVAHTLQLLRGSAQGKETALLTSKADIGFTLAFSWATVIEIQEKLNDYEERLKSDVLSKHFSSTQESRSLSAASGLAPSAAMLSGSQDPFALLNIEESSPTLGAPDSGYTLVIDCLNNAKSSTELALTYDEVMSQSIFPLLFAQHRLLSYSIFELLFTEHQLLSHLTLQHRFQLLGDGMFAARLSVALFDSEQSSGEGRRRTGSTAGLRLQAREAWPPASSELRLVLMGVLSESMSASGPKDLEDAVSFAIRELPEDEMDRCRNVDSIHALDFLKLQYRPPSPVLEAVISVESLEKYDRIFQHLLRVLRLKSTAQGLLREVTSRGGTIHDRADHRFRIGIQTFVLAVADYSQNVAVNWPWATFEAIIHEIERKLAAKDYDGVLSVGQSLDSLKRKHEDTLDSILRALFLKRKQKQALEVLNNILGLILRYAAASRKKGTDDETIKPYYVEFRDLVRRFVGLLQDMGRNTEPKGSHGEGDMLFEELLLRLNYNGYWSG